MQVEETDQDQEEKDQEEKEEKEDVQGGELIWWAPETVRVVSWRAFA